MTLLYVSNLYHLLLVAGAWTLIELYLRKTGATRFRAAMRLLQILPVIFCADIFIGIFVIDALYGDQQSAGWIAKSVWIYPGLFLLSIWRMVRAWRAERRARRQS